MKRTRPLSASRYPLLEKYRNELSRCVKCGACGAVCPSFQQERNESFSTRGRMALVKAVLEERLRVSEIFKDRLAACTTCLACEASCPSGVRVTEIIQAAKEQAMNETGMGIINSLISATMKHPVLCSMGGWFAPFVLHYTKGQGSTPLELVRHALSGARVIFSKKIHDCEPALFSVSKGVRVKGYGESSKFKVQNSKEAGGGGAIKKNVRGRVAFFPGCAINYVQQDIGRSVVSVLVRLGYEVIVPKAQRCCGRPLLSLGDRKSAEKLAAHNATLFSGLGADAVVTACASCGLTFKREYSKLLRSGVKVPLVLDIHEFLSDALAGIELKPVRKSVTCHDPCHLNRGQGLSGTVRNILQSIPGLTLVEMTNPDQCCGFGGVMRVTHRELSDGIAENKVRDIMRTGASTVVTGCPGCRMQIADALRRTGSEVEAAHTIQVLEEALSSAE